MNELMNETTDYNSKENIDNEILKKIIGFINSTENKNECNICFNTLNANMSGNYTLLKDKNIINKHMMDTSIIILTANRFERNVLHIKAKDEGQTIYQIEMESIGTGDKRLIINAYFFSIAGYNVLHMTANQTGSYSMGGSADLIRLALNNQYCFPDAIISFGLCFGNDYHKQQFGNTIIANKIYPYFMSAHVDDDGIRIEDNNIFDIDNRLSVQIHNMRENGVLKESEGEYIGRLITGEAVISNEIIKQVFIRAAAGGQKILGGEMEGYGLFKECRGYEHKIKCLIIKSICDWGAMKNIDADILIEKDMDTNIKDKIQAFAVYRAYDVLIKILRNNHPIFKHSLYEVVSDKIIYNKENKYMDSLSKRDLLNMIRSELGEMDLCKTVTGEYIDLFIKRLFKDNIIKKIQEEIWEVLPRN